MSVSALGATVALALLQGALVALPRASALASLRRARSPLWVTLLPGVIIVGTFAPLAARSLALTLVVAAALATPPLAIVAVLAVVRPRRAALVALALAAGVLVSSAAGTGRELSAALVTALGCATLGVALARLIPTTWILPGVACMCAADVALLAAGIGQPASLTMTAAAGHLGGPLFDQAQVGRTAIDYPDLVLAALLGGHLAGRRGQRRAAALVTVLSAAMLALAPPGAIWPATPPVALTLIALHAAGLPQRRAVQPLAPQGATA